MTGIPHIPLIEITPRLPNARLFELCGKRNRTPLEEVELAALWRTLEAEEAEYQHEFSGGGR
jgi:hypothetical protein